MFLLLAQLVAATPAPMPTATPWWPDYQILVRMADVAQVPRAPVLAIAWLESRDNTDPNLRGHHCWHGATKTTPALYQPNCEVGRFQIKPSTAKARCPGLDIFTRQGNYICFLFMFRHDFVVRGPEWAIMRHRGGTATENAAYLRNAQHVASYVALNLTQEPSVCLVRPEGD